jgi:predicted RecB family endonuclease
VAALVRAIRQAYKQDDTPGGVEMFYIRNVHEFAEKLVAAGVTVQQKEAA